MRGVVFQMGGGLFLSGGWPIGEASVVIGGLEESRRMGAAPPMPTPTMVNPRVARQSLMGGGLKSKHEGSMRELKMLLKIPVKEFI